MTETIESLRAERDALKQEVSNLRDGIIDLYHLQIQKDRDSRAAWAIRQTANRLDEPFSFDRVREAFKEQPGPALLLEVFEAACRYIDSMRANVAPEALKHSKSWTSSGLPEAVDAARRAP